MLIKIFIINNVENDFLFEIQNRFYLIYLTFFVTIYKSLLSSISDPFNASLLNISVNGPKLNLWIVIKIIAAC